MPQRCRLTLPSSNSTSQTARPSAPHRHSMTPQAVPSPGMRRSPSRKLCQHPPVRFLTCSQDASRKCHRQWAHGSYQGGCSPQVPSQMPGSCMQQGTAMQVTDPQGHPAAAAAAAGGMMRQSSRSSPQTAIRTRAPVNQHCTKQSMQGNTQSSGRLHHSHCHALTHQAAQLGGSNRSPLMYRH